jgi:uncharacterized protein
MLSVTENLRSLAAPSTAQPIQSLSNRNKTEVLDFLSIRPLHTFVMTGWIRDNGLTNPLNRGKFYGYRNPQGRLEGVALIGHVTLFETDSEDALSVFSRLTQNCPTAKAVMGEENKMSRFLAYYTNGRPVPRQVCRELVFERCSKQPLDGPTPNLRLATQAEAELVIKVHAERAAEETGVNPLGVDPDGFRQRCARRIEQERVWVAVEDKRLVFKADVICELPEVSYLEGVYVSPERRGNGFGRLCMRHLTNLLLSRTKSVCLLIKEQNLAAKACYQRAGYQVRDYYQTVFLHKN